jgi:hypothetical protein
MPRSESDRGDATTNSGMTMQDESNADLDALWDSLDPMQRSLLEVLSASEVLAEQRPMLISLILVYTCIDTMAWLIASKGEKVGSRYRSWVSRYLLPAAPRMACTADELYAARCAILHTMTADGDGQQRGRNLVYAQKDLETLELWVRSTDPMRFVAIDVADLLSGARLGCAAMFEQSRNDKVLRERIEAKRDKFFTFVPSSDPALQALRSRAGSSSPLVQP